jgi:DNA polymerase III epsilon subunit-like protein
MMRLASELIANADFACGFCRHRCARFDGGKYCQIALCTRLLARGHKQQVGNIPFKNGGLNRLSANLNRHAVAKSP